jgi:hypothetical protein
MSQEYIGAMTDDELRGDHEPALRALGADWAVDLLLQDVGHEPGSLPLLARCWRRGSDDGRR